MVEFRQGFRSMAAPTRELEKLIVSQKLAHGGNPVTRWRPPTSPSPRIPGDLNPAKDKSDRAHRRHRRPDHGDRPRHAAGRAATPLRVRGPRPADTVTHAPQGAGLSRSPSGSSCGRSTGYARTSATRAPTARGRSIRSRPRWSSSGWTNPISGRRETQGSLAGHLHEQLGAAHAAARLHSRRREVVNVRDLGQQHFHSRPGRLPAPGEPILYGWKDGSDHYWCGARDQGDVWFVDKPIRNDLHPTMKPVALVERAIRNSSKPGTSCSTPSAGRARP